MADREFVPTVTAKRPACTLSLSRPPTWPCSATTRWNGWPRQVTSSRFRTAVLAKALELDGKRRLDQLKFLAEQFKAVREQIANIRF